MSNPISLLDVNLNAAKPRIMAYLKAGVVPFLRGSPGVGKSDMIRGIAEANKLKVIDLRLGQCDPTDLNGFPSLKGDKATYVPMDTFPLESDPIPEGYNGWLLFFDEITSASKAIQAAAYKIILEREVGQHKLHPAVQMIAAGNRETDGAVVHEMSTALRSRIAHVSIAEPSIKEWTEWAQRKGLDHRVVSFLNFKPSLLYKFQADLADETFPCPRTWEFVSNVMIQIPDNKQLPGDLTGWIAGLVGQAAAAEFTGYLRVYSKLPTYEEIIANPETAKTPDEPGARFAVSGMMASKTFADDPSDEELSKRLDAGMTYICRLDKEYQVVGLKGIIGQGQIQKRFDIMTLPEQIKDWAMKNAQAMFGDG